MRHKLEIPWTSRLPVTRWWYRRHSPMTSFTASSQGNVHESRPLHFRSRTVEPSSDRK
jgi:hypothetical protein